MRKSRPGQKSLSRTGFCAFPSRLPDRGHIFPGGTGARNLPAVLEAYEDRMRRRALPTGRPCPAWRGAWGCREPRSTKSPRRAKARRGFADSGPDRSRQRGAVIYRRRKQRMPSAIRARKAQHGAAPTQSPAPEAQASMRMSAAGRAPTAEAVPQQSRASARDGVRSTRSTPGRSAGKPPKPAAAAAAKKRGAVDVAAARARCPAHSRANTSPPSAGAPGSRPGEHRGSVLWDQPFYQDAQIRPAGQPPRSPAYAPGAEIVRVSVYIHKFLNIKINIRKFNTHIENLCKNDRTKLEKLCKMILE